MEIIEPKYRFGGNWEELATLFNYTIDSLSQDWTYEIAEPERIDDYIQAYNKEIKNEDTKFSLMEMIIQALEDQGSIELIKLKWALVKPLLLKDFDLHQFTIFYWSCWDNENIEDSWVVTPLFRELWLNK
ncbi:hypothetical protein [Reichenbachiella versicolor]|uniref:hypothetical protein n=1 Tax=Reichenbachiella versicolor TaxID=1821036 RepID=UPI000D6E33E8|nr:hypothetical protein [Reichenbachiella versicolor]